jgi:stearoyl-CoA desaturase (delta-9 desaturase)
MSSDETTPLIPQRLETDADAPADQALTVNLSDDNSLTGNATIARGDGPPKLHSVPEDEETSAMHKLGTLAVIILPFAAILIAIVLLWERAVDATDLLLLLGMHIIAGLGITVGFHRLLTHRSFETKGWVRGLLTAAGSLAIEGRPSDWVADHRRHHAYADEEGDPHSPYVGHEDGGFWSSIKGAWHAHIGWLLEEGQSSAKRFCPDLLKDRIVMRIDKQFPWFILLALVIPGVLGFVLTGGSWWGALTGAFWGGAVRIFITHHVTWSVNSICHMFGRRPFETTDKSTNNWLLAIPTLGEAWHHNHHTFPTSAFHGLRRWQKAMDPSGWVVWTLEKTGLAWNVKRVSPKQMAAKLRTPGGAGS